MIYWLLNTWCPLPPPGICLLPWSNGLCSRRSPSGVNDTAWRWCWSLHGCHVQIWKRGSNRKPGWLCTPRWWLHRLSRLRTSLSHTRTLIEAKAEAAPLATLIDPPEALRSPPSFTFQEQHWWNDVSCMYEMSLRLSGIKLGKPTATPDFLEICHFRHRWL